MPGGTLPGGVPCGTVAGGVPTGGLVGGGDPCGEPGGGVVAGGLVGGGVPCGEPGGGVVTGGGVPWKSRPRGSVTEPLGDISCATAGITVLNPATPAINSKNKTYHFLITQGSAMDYRPTCDRTEGYPFVWQGAIVAIPVRS